MQNAWELYKAKDYAGIIQLDSSDEVANAVSKMEADYPDSDRYITYISEDKTYSMLYFDVDHGYWWYFGDIADGAKEGNGVSFTVTGDGSYDMYVGEFKNDSPCGSGVMTMVDSIGEQ